VKTVEETKVKEQPAEEGVSVFKKVSESKSDDEEEDSS
jgi:hypothetical protein